MELWIRSQDKKQLLKVNDGLYIANGFTDETDSFIEIKNAGHIGRYKTEKRALEILDEIQRKITQNECLKTMIPKLNNVKGEEENIGELFKGMVYEMPKE